MSKSKLPILLDNEWDLRLEHYKGVATAQQSQWLESLLSSEDDFSFHLKKCWSCSEFVAMWCSKNPVMLKELIDSGDLYKSYKQSYMNDQLSKKLRNAITEDDLFKILRQFRNREVVRVVWRDFNKEADLEETTADMTFLAETCLQHALEFLYLIACDIWGTPTNSDGDPQKMVVLGMGKLGGWDLNISSDIDLIFAYPEQGKTKGAECTLSNEEFFTRLSQKLIKSLDSKNDDGFVFRVDMRLRPYGQSGNLILSFSAMEEYYQTQGREWERYAMIKARVVAGDQKSGIQLMAMLMPFTFRKYIDFSTLESLRKIKVLINREVQRKDISNNIKLGIGGIREVEFIVQAFQIIHGGRDTRFQSQSLKDILILMSKESLLPDSDIKKLQKNYKFLRNIEHILQGAKDLQTHMLPNTELEKLKLSYLMDCNDWDEFFSLLTKCRSEVQELFALVVANEQAPDKNININSKISIASDIWQCSDDEDMTSQLNFIGYTKPKDALILIQNLKKDRSVLFMPSDTRIRLDAFMPELITACAKLKNNTDTLSRVFQLIESIARRSAYLVLLKENPSVLDLTLQLCSASPWIAEQLSRNPALLDELLDHRTLYSLPDKDDLIDELRQRLLRIPSDDLEAQMEALRYFKLAHSLHVAACEVTEILPLLKVSDYLTSIAEAILTHTVEIAWDQMIERYGHPSSETENKPEFLIVGYGKLGSIELGHSSDLDLVFIYDANQNQSTDGFHPIDNETFFIRLGQKIIHILTTRLASGVLYEVDVRLRPSGRSGMLVSSLKAFKKYQFNDAWTWEHQALVRARPVVGSPRLIKKFNDIRSKVLCQKRDLIKLVSDVSSMRERIQNELVTQKGSSKKLPKKENAGDLSENDAPFNIKYDEGGIIDIEFIVQFEVLSHANQFVDLTYWSDNIRIIERLEVNNILSPQDAENLKKSYISYRSEGHKLQLQNSPLASKVSKFTIERKQVAASWNKIFRCKVNNN